MTDEELVHELRQICRKSGNLVKNRPALTDDQKAKEAKNDATEKIQQAFGKRASLSFHFSSGQFMFQGMITVQDGETLSF